MDHRRQTVLRPAETVEQLLDPSERQVDLARMQPEETLLPMLSGSMVP